MRAVPSTTHAGRAAYPPELAAAIVAEAGLDGSGRLLDVGCGPGSLTLLLAGSFEEAVGVDADADMLGEARRLAGEVRNCRWVHLRAEDLPAGLGRFRLVTFAQSFHWLDRPRVAATVRGMLEPGGFCAHVHATTHQGVEGSVPHAEITELVRSYLGPVRRAGQGSLPNGTAGGEAEVYRAAGFHGPRRFEVPGRDGHPHGRRRGGGGVFPVQRGAAPVRGATGGFRGRVAGVAAAGQSGWGVQRAVG